MNWKEQKRAHAKLKVTADNIDVANNDNNSGHMITLRIMIDKIEKIKLQLAAIGQQLAIMENYASQAITQTDLGNKFKTQAEVQREQQEQITKDKYQHQQQKQTPESSDFIVEKSAPRYDLGNLPPRQKVVSPFDRTMQSSRF